MRTHVILNKKIIKIYIYKTKNLFTIIFLKKKKKRDGPKATPRLGWGGLHAALRSTGAACEPPLDLGWGGTRPPLARFRGGSLPPTATFGSGCRLAATHFLFLLKNIFLKFFISFMYVYF
jgi:hypothetical protein